jgi:hypothetical protein
MSPKTGRLAPDKLVRLERDLMRAVKERTLDVCERVLADEFTLVTGRPGAEIRSRAEWLEVTADRYVLDTYEFESIDVSVYGHIAVVRTRHRQSATVDGDDRTGEYLTTDVWIRRGGRWQLVNRHLSPLGGTDASREA